MEEELSAGPPEDEGSGGRRRVWPALLLGMVAFGAGAVATGLINGSPSPSTPAATPTPSPVVYRTARPGPLTYLNVTSVCPPRTDGRRSLTVSFELSNVGGVRVDVLNVRPTLPLAGLTVVSPVRSGGTCAAPGHASVKQTIGVGETRIYTLTFRLPTECPKPYPVQATYRIDVNNQQMTTALPLLPDLGSVNFRSCT